jgi:hypothetical protein
MTGILNALIAGVSGAVKDTYFNLVSLLLPGNGTDGKQNRTFKDSSVNDFLITPNGNATQGTFSPFSQTGWGNYFDGSTAYLTVAANSAINDFGTGDFNIELWFYATTSNFTAEPTLIGCVVTWATSVAYQLEIRSGGVVYFFGGDSVPISINSGATTVSVNTWNHVAVSRASGTTRLFVNGAQASSTSTVATISKSSTAVSIGAFSVAATQKFTGYISNVRIVKGQALYTGNFTPPIEALTTTSVGTSGANVATSVTGTVGLLTCQSNRFFDQTGKTITVNGSPSVTPFSPFAPTAKYEAAAVGGSGYFDGGLDYLSVADSSAFTLGTNAFTAEAWVYPTTSSTSRMIMGQYEDADNTGSFLLYLNSGNKLVCIIPALSITITGATNVPANAWSHVVITRSGSSFAIFLNGSRDASPATNSGSLTDSTYAFTFGADRDGNNLLYTGYIASARLVNGTAVYDPTQTSITVPTAPLTAITNTSLLLNFTNAGVVDATAKNVLETVGNAQISTTQSKWGGGSILFDGTDDRLTNNNAANPLYAFRTGDFTIEAWVYPTVNTGERGWFQTSDTVGGLKTSYTTGVCMFTSPTPNAYWLVQVGSTAISTTTSVQTNTWTHVAITRTNGSVRVYIGGNLAAGPTSATADLTGQYLVVGGYYSTAYLFNGYIDDLRITNYSRYSGASLTVPTAPFPVQ